MQIQIYANGLEVGDAFREFVEQRIGATLAHHAERLTRVEVHFKDLNAGKGGIDKRCLLEARPRGMDPIAVEHDAKELRDSVIQASEKLQRALTNRFGRREAAG